MRMLGIYPQQAETVVTVTRAVDEEGRECSCRCAALLD